MYLKIDLKELTKIRDELLEKAKKIPNINYYEYHETIAKIELINDLIVGNIIRGNVTHESSEVLK